MSGTSKYTNPVGPGYQGIYKTDGWRVDVSISGNTHVDWEPGWTVVAADVEGEPGVQLADRLEASAIAECPVVDRGQGTLVSIPQAVLQALENFEGDGDIRVYEYRENSLTVVPAHSDPFVDGENQP